MPRRWSQRWWLALVMVLGLVATGCSGPRSQHEEHTTLQVGASQEPVGLDPATVSGAGTPFVLLYNVYETLVRVGHDGGIEGLLASEWQVSDENRTYTFTLRDATFASGQKVTAEAVQQSLQRILEERDVTDQLRSQMEPVDQIEAVDERTVRVRLKQPSNRWLYDMTGPAGIIYDPAGMDTLDERPAGSGPFTFGEWEPGSHVTLRRNENYWGTNTRIDEVRIRFFADPNAMTTAMLSGDLDVISNLTVPDSLGQFSDENRFRVLEGATDGEVVLGFNHTHPALADVRVRQAICHAIDRKALRDSVWGGKGPLIGSMVSPLDPWYEDLSQTYPYDPARAKRLLADAGHATGLKLRLRVPTLPYGPGSARFVAAQLKEVGIEVVVEELENARWLDQVFTKSDYDMTIVAHVEPRDLVAFADPEYYWHYDNPRFRELVDKADAGTREEETEHLRRAARMLADDAAADWLFLLPNLVITTTRVTGLSENATNLSFDLTNVAVSE